MQKNRSTVIPKDRILTLVLAIVLTQNTKDFKMNAQQAICYLQDYYTQNWSDDCSFDEMLEQVGDTLDMVSEDLAEAFRVYNGD